MPISKPVEYPSKFTPVEIAAKALIRKVRKERRLSMVDGEVERHTVNISVMREE